MYKSQPCLILAVKYSSTYIGNNTLLIHALGCPTVLPCNPFQLSTNSTTINTEVTFHCDAGYVIVGHQHITCTLLCLHAFSSSVEQEWDIVHLAE